jgi:nucleoside-diphosphate-sugar epimerase
MDALAKNIDKKKILITGGGGYLGSSMALKMAPSGDDLFLLDVAFNKISINLNESFSNVQLIQGDLTKLPELKEICKDIQPTHILHFAASMDRSRSFSIFEEMSRINVSGTMNLLESLSDIPYEFFGFSSTSEVYGTKNPLPFDEDQLPSPVSPYSLTKLMAEDLIRTWSALNKKPFTIFRIFLFIGPEMPATTFFGQLQQAYVKNEEFIMTKGEQRRDYLVLDDLLESITSILRKRNANGEIINLCSGSSVSIKEITNTIKVIAGNRLRISDVLPYRQNEIWDIRGSNEKLKKLLPEFSPKSISEYIYSLFEF